MIIVGIVIIIYAGIELFLSRGNEEAFKAKIQQTLYLALGFGVMLLAQTVIYELFFGKEGEIFFDGAAGTYEEKARNTFLEMKGVYDYVAMFAIAILLLLVIVTLFQFMLAAETDEAKGRLQRQLIWGSIGVMVLGAVDRFIKIFFGDSGSEKLTEAPDITSAGSETILGEVVGWTNFMLSYVAFGAVLAIIAGGASLIFFLGDDDRIEKGKSMIKYAVVALVICFSAWVAINYFLIPETA